LKIAGRLRGRDNGCFLHGLLNLLFLVESAAEVVDPYDENYKQRQRDCEFKNG
jgi:hypothetical protein